MTEQTKRMPRGRYGENGPEWLKELADRFNKRAAEHIQDQEHLDSICDEAIESNTFPLFRIQNEVKISSSSLFVCEKAAMWKGYVLWDTKAILAKGWGWKHLVKGTRGYFPSIVFKWDKDGGNHKAELPHNVFLQDIPIGIDHLHYAGYNYNPEIDYQETPVTITVEGFEYKIWQVGLRWMRNHPGWVIGSWWYEPQGDFNYGEPGASCSIRGCDSYQDAVENASKFEKVFKAELTKARIPKTHRRKSYGWPNMDRLRKRYQKELTKNQTNK